MRLATMTLAFAPVLALAGCGGEVTSLDESDADSATALASGGAGYRPAIQADLEARGCTAAGGCHGGAATMKVSAQPTSDAAWRANHGEVRARAGTVSSSLLLAKAAGAGGHPALVAATDPVALRWRAWIEAGAPLEPPRPAGDGGGSPDAATAVLDGGAPDAMPAPTWTRDVAPLLGRVGCVRCHGGDGNYSLESYAAALGPGRDSIPNVIPGNPLSLLATYSEQGHQGMAYRDALIVLSWIVDGQASER